EWSPGRENQFYTFTVKKDDSGVLMASARSGNATDGDVSRSADEKLLTALQSVIDERHLAGENGVYRVTAGLPPQFQKCHFDAGYASGEKLTFTKNNNPDAEWAREIYMAFANWFAERGDASLLPPGQSFGPIKDFSFAWTEDGKKTRCAPVHVQEEKAIDGERLLLGKSVYDVEAKQSLSREYTLFPEDYAERIREILSAHDLRAFDYHSVFYKKRKKEEHPALEIHVNFTDGSHLYIDVSDATDIEALRPLTAELAAYHDALFEE
ncbi:MAG: hypothetical protein IJ812_01350, partial [Schwartzia sp.]|nr:hypothetical protein [Schwartzia sp. (in: firmicutes)]